MWLGNAKLILSDRVIERGSVRIEGERIAEVVEGSINKADWDLHGLTLAPGIIDMHGDMIEREIEPRPGVHLPFDMALIELDKRLIANGVTTAYAAISFAELWDKRELRREERACEIVTAIAQHRDGLLCDMRVHARFEVTNLRAPPVLLDLIEKGQVDLVSVNDHTPGQGQYRDLEKYVMNIATWRFVSADAAATMTQQRIAEMQSTPAAWDVVREVTQLALQHHLPIASHDDDTSAKVGFMAELGTTISEFPVTMEAALEAKRRGMHVVMGAPAAIASIALRQPERDGRDSGWRGGFAGSRLPPRHIAASCVCDCKTRCIAFARSHEVGWPECSRSNRLARAWGNRATTLRRPYSYRRRPATACARHAA